MSIDQRGRHLHEHGEAGAVEVATTARARHLRSMEEYSQAKQASVGSSSSGVSPRSTDHSPQRQTGPETIDQQARRRGPVLPRRLPRHRHAHSPSRVQTTLQQFRVSSTEAVLSSTRGPDPGHFRGCRDRSGRHRRRSRHASLVYFAQFLTHKSSWRMQSSVRLSLIHAGSFDRRV